MLKIFKMKKKILIAIGIIILILIAIGGKIVMDKLIQSKQRQELALKDERVIAQKIKENFSGIEEITFYSTSKLPSEPGGYECEFSVKYLWSSSLSKRARTESRSINYDSLGKADEIDNDNLVSEVVGFVEGKSSDIYLKHLGQTQTTVKVIYPNGEEEEI